MAKYHSQYVIKNTYAPLKKLLILLQLQFNKNRYTQIPSLQDQGMHTYWISKLRDNVCNIPKADQITYSNFIDQLESTTFSSEQKIRIIEIMFKDFSFLQKI